MNSHEIKVTFQPSGRSVFVLPGTPVVEAAGRAGIILQTPCGGHGTCGKCRVRVVSGDPGDAYPNNSPLERTLFDAGWRLACVLKIYSPLVIDVPAESMFESRQQILTSDSGTQGDIKPVVTKHFFQLDPPTREDVRSDVARLRAAVGVHVAVGEALTRRLPTFLRANAWQGTAVVANETLLALEAGDTTGQLYGVAFDIGTTTVVGTLFELVGGGELAVASRVNSQVTFGDDVLSRILRIREQAGGLDELQHAILETMNQIIASVVSQARIAQEHIYELVVAGNSTMQQVLAGYDPAALGEVPFVQVFDEAQILSAARLGLAAAPGAQVYMFPQIGGFVGGDTVAGMLASRLDRWERPVLLVDIGTNGELVLACNGRMEAASTAAGPAFEGARITQGMRATAGAIEKVLIDGDVELNVIGNTKPAGLCGTALIDAVAGLLTAGVIDETGRILPPDELPASVPAALRDRIEILGNDARFVLVEANQAATGEPICLWQRDVRELQLASGALRAGINILMRRAGLEASDLGAILLAGAFGNFIRRSNACRIGLLPPVPGDAVRFIGNAASLGAKLALLSENERQYASALRANVEHVDLSYDPEFQMEFAMAMMFPGPDVACREDNAQAGA
jgi:uncharacterized 2Fe-2S/4Fe-4S cluster protein (DUF4445 family)